MVMQPDLYPPDSLHTASASRQVYLLARRRDKVAVGMCSLMHLTSALSVRLCSEENPA